MDVEQGPQRGDGPGVWRTDGRTDGLLGPSSDLSFSSPLRLFAFVRVDVRPCVHTTPTPPSSRAPAVVASLLLLLLAPSFFFARLWAHAFVSRWAKHTRTLAPTPTAIRMGGFGRRVPAGRGQRRGKAKARDDREGGRAV